MLLHDFLSHSAQRHPGKVACICGETRLTYAALETKANALAQALIDAEVPRGARVAVFLENRIETVAAIFGILKAGATFVVINATIKPDKLCFMLNDCSASAVVLPGRARAALDAIVRTVASIRCIATCGPGIGSSDTGERLHLDLDTILDAQCAPPPDIRCIDLDVCAIVYTSGSTGKPKGVVGTHHSMSSAIRSIAQYQHNVPGDIILDVLPLSFTYGLSQLLIATYVGAALVLERSFAYPYQAVKRVVEERVTGFPGVPTIFATLLQMQEVTPADFEHVRYVTNAGAALAPAHLAGVRQLFSNAEVFLMHGLTECVRTTYLPPEELDRRPTSVGRGMPNEELFVMDVNGTPVRPGEVGELVVRGANVMKGYWGRPEETARALKLGDNPWERWLYTGDLFTVDEEGFLYFVSRKDDIIKSRGEKVSPLEVENVINELPDILEVAVLGVPDELLGEAIKAVVVLREDSKLTSKAIIGHCARRLENFMVPKYVSFEESLPKTTSGKIRRTTLKEREDLTSKQTIFNGGDA